MKPILTVVIAVYNAEKWLPRCLRSVLAQSLQDLEILLIDDGSTDDSPRICDMFALKDQRIKVFHRINAGVSATRQFGIDHATGEYMIYLDSDDFIDPTMYERMYYSAKETGADLVVCDWYSVYGDIMYAEKLQVKQWDTESLLCALLQDQPTYQTIFLFKHELFNRLDVGFPKGRVMYGEDTIMLISLLSAGITSGYGMKISHVSAPLYYYDRTINSSSLMKLSKKEMNRTRLNLWINLAPMLHSIKAKTALNNRIVKYLFIALWNRFYSDEYYADNYSTMLPDIKRYASPSIEKTFVHFALIGHASFIMRNKFIAFPIVLRERWKQRKKDNESLPIPKELSKL